MINGMCKNAVCTVNFNSLFEHIVLFELRLHLHLLYKYTHDSMASFSVIYPPNTWCCNSLLRRHWLAEVAVKDSN